MPEGVASSPRDFQRKMEDCLRDIPNTIAYLDNIYVTDRNEQEHYDTLKAILRRLEECGLKVNVEKCDFLRKELELLGFLIDKRGLHKAPSKIKAMIEAPRPKNPKELASFLGLITYYARFLPNRAEMLKPLYECTKCESFVWSDECEKAFKGVKGVLASEKILAHYHVNEELVLACDASGYDLSAILSH
ncbi:reverse transcriptase, partial [Lasius niger]